MTAAAHPLCSNPYRRSSMLLCSGCAALFYTTPGTTTAPALFYTTPDTTTAPALFTVFALSCYTRSTMIINISELCKSYLEKPILKNVSFHVEDREKCAIVGINGCGKTTLLRCIVGEEEPDSGIIALSKGKRLAYLAQQHADMAHEDEDYDTLSGGQKTRRRLEELLQSKPELLILDEPTNHLDIDSIQWLEKVLKYYEGAVILVSHDRYFLDRVVTKIVDLEAGRARVYKGNYSAYAEKKRLLREAEIKAYLNQQETIRHQEAVIEKLRSFNREKSIRRAESREKMLDKIERLERPVELNNEMQLALEPAVLSGNDVLRVEQLSKRFDDNTLFQDVNFEIKRGEHIAVIGANGSGKTTLLKILNGLEHADSGSFRLGSRVLVGYYDQEHAVLDMDKTIFDEIQDSYPKMNNTRVRNVLAAFLFTGDDVYKRIGDLSGGEKGRVSLAKLMLSDCNFLILDEPTNHLDIQGKEILEDAIRNYGGTILYVSHDRYFINQTASRILELHEQRFLNYIGNYDYYLEKREDVRRAAGITPGGGANSGAGPAAAAPEIKSENRLDWELQKEQQRELRKLQNDLRKCEAEIESLEADCAALEEAMADPALAANAARLMELHQSQADKQTRLELLYENWTEYSARLEAFEQTNA